MGSRHGPPPAGGIFKMIFVLYIIAGAIIGLIVALLAGVVMMVEAIDELGRRISVASENIKRERKEIEPG